MLPDCKSVLVIPPVAVTSNATNTATWDTRGYDYCILDVTSTKEATPGGAPTKLAVREADTACTDETDGYALTAFYGGTAVSTSAGFVRPAASSSFANNYRFNIDLRGRRRYLLLNFNPTSSCTIMAQAYLYRAADGPADATVATSADGTRSIASG